MSVADDQIVTTPTAVETRPQLLVVATLVAAMTLCWIVVTPPSAGPDEPGHLVRGAALVRGQLAGEPGEFGPARRGFELPAWVGFPDPVCFAFQPYTAASCAADLPRPDGDAVLGTRASEYPIWGHVLAGVGTLVPKPAWSPWVSRALEAVVSVVLVGVALAMAARRDRLTAAATLLAVTPMAWFMAAVVNPSSMAIAGGVMLWVAGLEVGSSPSRATRWWVAVGWSALVLPRRDGLVWALVIVALLALLERRTAWAWWRALGRGPASLMVVSALATLAWAATSSSRVSRALLAVPIGFAVVDVVTRLWPRVAVTRTRAVGAAAVVAAVAAVGTVAVMGLRPSGMDTDLLVIVVGRTGEHLIEAIGLLGWLDTPLPASVVMLWMIGLGVLLAGSLQSPDRRPVVTGGIVVAVAVVSSWVLEMFSGNTSGTYWQGRYYLPLLVGVPILFGRAALARDVTRTLSTAVGVIAVVVVNAALAAAVRRWAVGIGGSYFPWDWHTYGAPVHPGVVVAAHVAVSILLLARLMAGPSRAPLEV